MGLQFNLVIDQAWKIETFRLEDTASKNYPLHHHHHQNHITLYLSIFLLRHEISTGVIQLIPPVLSSETLLHILLSSEYSGFRPSTTAVVIIGTPILVPTGPTDRR